MTKMNCHVSAKQLAMSLFEQNLNAVNAPHAVIRVADVDAIVIGKEANLATRNRRNGLDGSRRGTPGQRENLSRRENLSQLGILNRSESPDQLARLDLSESPDQLGSLDLPRQVTKSIAVAGLGRHSSRLSFRTFRPGRRPSAVWYCEHQLKNMRAERKLAVDATADALHVAKTDSAIRS